MISRCSSPMPEMMVWPVSSSTFTRKVGSSAMSLPSAPLILSMSAWVFGSMATLMTGAGNSIASSRTGSSRSQMVSPVLTFFRPTAAAMSPAQISGISSRLLACILRSRPIR